MDTLAWCSFWAFIIAIIAAVRIAESSAKAHIAKTFAKLADGVKEIDYRPGDVLGTATFVYAGKLKPMPFDDENKPDEGGVMADEFSGPRIITYFGQPMKVDCDRACDKAWGMNNRPKVQLSANEDDYEYLADGELAYAPTDPGTYEGGHAKPLTPIQFPNKWCVRECERCARSAVGRSALPLALPDFSKRRRNIG